MRYWSRPQPVDAFRVENLLAMFRSGETMPRGFRPGASFVFGRDYIDFDDDDGMRKALIGEWIVLRHPDNTSPFYDRIVLSDADFKARYMVTP